MGLSANIPDDHAMLEHGMVIYDALYTWCRDLHGEIQTGPPENRRLRQARTGPELSMSAVSTKPVELSPDRGEPAHGVSFAEAFRVWLRVALLSFGGPAGQIAVMHRIVIDERRWISRARFLHALNYCHLLPGPEAQQLAIYIGWLMHRTLGGLVAGTLFVVPGVVALMVLSWIYVIWGNVDFVAGLSSASRRRCLPS